MTITQDPSAPLVAVVGVTGVQGGSVVNGLAESNKPYRVRGFSRDASKPAAQAMTAKGVEVVSVSLVVDNKDAVYKAFAGADVAYLVTNYWEHQDMQREIAEGKLLIDAAKAGGVKRIVWSGLPSFTKLSGGKYTQVEDFDGKAVVSDYGRASGVPFVDVQAGYYGDTMLTLPVLLGKQADGSLAMPWPLHPDTKLPFIDAPKDYGLYVRHVLELPSFPAGETLVACSELITLSDMAKQLSAATGKDIAFKEISLDQFKKNLAGMGMPPVLQERMAQAWGVLADFGWEATPAAGLPRSTSSWAAYCKATDWSKALA